MKKYLISLLLILLIAVTSCRDRMEREASLILSQMSTDQKIGQMMMVGVPGNKISSKSKKIIENNLPGGIILYGYNLLEKDQIKNFIEKLQQASIATSDIPLFVSIDEEGGRVKRITDGVTQFPGNMAFGIVEDESLVFDAARILGIQLRLIGVNMNLAPVLDVNNNPDNPVINTRSFGSIPSVVSKMGVSYIKGMQKSGCIAVAKHFPGHGDTDKDSHITLPYIQHDFKRLQEVEFPPFIDAIDAGVEGIMTAHISFPNILHNNLPATISMRFLKDTLRKKMEFNGLIISDDLEMKAISKLMKMGDVAVSAIKAGVDIVLISSHGNNTAKVFKAIKHEVSNGALSLDRINNSVLRILEVKLRYGIMGFQNGMIKYGKIKYSEDETELLQEAVEINRKFSRRSIYYYAKKNYNPVPGERGKHTKIFITSNEILKEEIIKNIKDSNVLDNESKFFKYSAKLKDNNKKKSSINSGAVVYYHIGKVDPEVIKKVVSVTQGNGMELFLLSTGNPFLLSHIEDLPPTFFSFSNTEESLKQLLAAVQGKFDPKEEINVHLGINNPVQ